MGIRGGGGWLTAVSAALCLLIACRPAHHAVAQTIEVSFAVPHHRAMYDETTAAFRRAFPGIDVRFVTPASNYDELVQATLRASLARQAPDVAFQGYNRIGLLVERGLATPLDDLVAEERDLAARGYVAASLDACRARGRLYGIPHAISSPVVYFNAELVRRAGGDPGDLPHDWGGILALARRIAALPTRTQGAVLDYKGNGNWGFLALLNSLGGSAMTPDDSRLLLDSTETLRALEIIRAFGEAGQIDMSRVQWRQSFAAGDLGIYVGTSSLLTEFQREAAGRFAVRVVPFPLAAGGRLPVGGACAMILTSDPARRRAAWEYIKFATGPVGQTIVVNHTGYMPSNRLAIDDPALLGAFYQRNPDHMVAVRQLPVITAWYAFPGENSVRISAEIEEVLVRVATLRQAPADAQRDLIARVSAMLPRR